MISLLTFRHRLQRFLFIQIVIASCRINTLRPRTYLSCAAMLSHNLCAHPYCMYVAHPARALFCTPAIYIDISTRTHTCLCGGRRRRASLSSPRISGAYAPNAKACARNIITMTDLSDSFVFMSARSSHCPCVCRRTHNREIRTLVCVCAMENLSFHRQSRCPGWRLHVCIRHIFTNLFTAVVYRRPAMACVCIERTRTLLTTN